MVAEANARPTTMRLLDKVPIRRVSDTAAHQILKLQTQRLWVSTATTWYIHFRMDRGWYILNCLLLLFVIQCCNVYYCWQVCCFVILACSKSFSGTLGDRNTQTCNGKYTEELFQAKWFLDMSLFRETSRNGLKVAKAGQKSEIRMGMMTNMHDGQLLGFWEAERVGAWWLSGIMADCHNG